jgi:hypothetical protein
MFFDGTRPTTISATAPDNSLESLELSKNVDNNGNSLDILGNDLPFGQGRQYDPDDAYTFSLIVAGKVLPSTFPNVTYTWKRYLQDRGVTIKKTVGTNGPYWYVQSINNDSPPGLSGPSPDPTGFPVPVDDTDSDVTTIPSPKGILYCWDNPAMVTIAYDSCNVNDFAYEQVHFIIKLTISIGPSSSTSIFNIGQVMTIKRTGTADGGYAQDWQGLGNIVNSTNIPDCKMPNDPTHIALIRNIVGGSLPIVIDPHANDNNPNP